jgi:uncharacterized protein
MILLDVNILLYAHASYAPDHPAYVRWLEGVLRGDEPYGMSDLVLSAFLRIATNPRIFRPPSSMHTALDFAEAIRSNPRCTSIAPGPRHWQIFTRLCRTAGVKSNLVPDAYFAALAIESGSEWITTDRDFSRFPGLRWRHPLD